MMILTLKLLIAHLLGDFVLQPDKWVKEKKLRQHKSGYLYIHIGVHALALFLMLQFKWQYWPLIIVISISHALFDLIKIKLDGKFNNRLLFALDQVAHLFVIALMVYFYEPYRINIGLLYSQSFLLLICTIILLTSVTSVVIKNIMNKWPLNEDPSTNSLENAGKYIGMLERLFVFGFIILNQWQAIGLLIAAKSVFRFSDLSRARDRKLTEYILIGTLLSFGLAVIIGLGYQYATAKWISC